MTPFSFLANRKNWVSALLFLLVFLQIGCPGPPEEWAYLDDNEILFFFYPSDMPIETGIAGTRWSISAIIPYARKPIPHRVFFSGEGSLWDGSIPQNLTPMNISKEFSVMPGSGVGGIYLPPPEVAAEGITISFGCEVQNPKTKNWVRSPDYSVQVVNRSEPIEFFIGSYGTTTSPLEGRHYTFNIHVDPCLDDNQLQFGLTGPEGYVGELGELSLQEYSVSYGGKRRNGSSYGIYSFKYTPPQNVKSSIEVEVAFSIYDPWAKERRELRRAISIPGQ